MSLIPSEIKNEWKRVAQLLNSKDGGLGVRCKLIFSAGVQIDATVPEDNEGNKPRTILSYGGRSPARTNTGFGFSNEESNGLKEQIVEKIIEGRVYSITKPFERFSMGIQDDRSVFQLITEKKHMPDLIGCKEAIFNIDLPDKRLRVKLLRPPVPYGLGQSVQCKSLWEFV